MKPVLIFFREQCSVRYCVIEVRKQQTLDFARQSSQVLAPELHEVVPLDSIGLTPLEVGGYPGEEGKTYPGKES